MDQCDERVKRVVVVGGGASGLRAARRLREEHDARVEVCSAEGRTVAWTLEVIVLEACAHCGGRVRQTVLRPDRGGRSTETTTSGSCRDQEAEEELSDGVLVEVGAELMHGRDTYLTRTADEHGWRRRALCVWAQGDGGPSAHPVGGGVARYFDAERAVWYAHDDTDESFCALNSFFDSMSDSGSVSNSGGKDDTRSVKEALMDAGGGAMRLMAMAEAGYANTLGASLSTLSWSEMCAMEEYWDGEGEQDSRLEGTFKLLIDHMKEGIDVRTRCIVTRIEHCAEVHADNGCVVEYIRAEDEDREKDNGQEKRGNCACDTSFSEFPMLGGADVRGSSVAVTCDHVIVTVPVPVLQDGDIAFEPPLPEVTQRGIAKLGWARHCVKLHLLFARRWWRGADIHGIIASGCDVPEMWFDTRPRRMGELVTEIDHSDGDGQIGTREGDASASVGGTGEEEGKEEEEEEELLVVSGFAMDAFAERLSELGDTAAIELFLSQLDTMFGCAHGAAPDVVCTPSSVFIQGWCMDWSKHAFVRGGYSFPREAGSADARAHLASTTAAGADQRILFAGEHCGIHCTTVHAAVESGERAAAQVIDLLHRGSSHTYT